MQNLKVMPTEARKISIGNVLGQSFMKMAVSTNGENKLRILESLNNGTKNIYFDLLFSFTKSLKLLPDLEKVVLNYVSRITGSLTDPEDDETVKQLIASRYSRLCCNFHFFGYFNKTKECFNLDVSDNKSCQEAIFPSLIYFMMILYKYKEASVITAEDIQLVLNQRSVKKGKEMELMNPHSVSYIPKRMLTNVNILMDKVEIPLRFCDHIIITLSTNGETYLPCYFSSYQFAILDAFNMMAKDLSTNETGFVLPEEQVDLTL